MKQLKYQLISLGHIAYNEIHLSLVNFPALLRYRDRYLLTALLVYAYIIDLKKTKRNYVNFWQNILIHYVINLHSFLTTIMLTEEYEIWKFKFI